MTIPMNRDPNGTSWNPHDCLTIPQTAQALQVSEGTVRNLIRRRELRACRVVGKLRIRRLELARYLDRVTDKDSYPEGGPHEGQG